MAQRVVLVVCGLALLSLPARSAAQWSVGGNPVCTAVRSQVSTRAVPDGAGGVIVAWSDLRNGGWDLYAQRLNSAGQPVWTLDGVPLCRARGDQDPQGMIPDGSGGAIVVWHDYRCGGTIYAQRVDATGHALWTANGVALADTASEQEYSICASDGAGGVIAFWLDSRAWRQYGQRIDEHGTPRWGAAGLLLPFNGSTPAITADGARGVFAAYSLSNGMFGQHLDSTGTALWSGGATLCFGNTATQPTVVADAQGGMIAAWSDGRYVSHPHIFAQRLASNGAPVWIANGVPVCVANNDQRNPFAVPDGAGGAIVTWTDARSMAGTDLYGRRIGANGDTLWSAQGVPVCTAAGSQSAQWMAQDGQGGAIVAWADHRGADMDIYAQRVAHDGAMRWAANGLALCTLAGDQADPQVAADGHGGALAAWNDARAGIAHVHVYAQRVDSTGGAPGNTSVGPAQGHRFQFLSAAPNPARSGVSIVFELPAPAQVSAEVYDAHGRRVRVLAAREALVAGWHTVAWDGHDTRGAAAEAGIYFVRVRAGGEEGRCKLVLMH